ncbi:MAG: chromosome segregation protein SMC, partial [Lachnospiraceae bacterium]|nr:chromosome segregation protein SMC [Lachnospiraceae bacterium]
SQKLNTLNEMISENQNIFHSRESKLETIKNMLERYEGYGNACKAIMDEKDRFGGIKGVVADLFETEEKYEVAVETAIGNNIQNIVTKDVDTAKKIFDYLNENKLGRLTALPLTSIVYKEDDVYDKASRERGVIDRAVELVKYDSEYDRLAKYLLSRCLVVDTFENAKNIFEKYNSQLKLVTLNGELFNPGGALTGGRYRNQSNLMGRKREFEELKVAIEDIKNKIDKLNADKQSLSEDNDKIYNDIENTKASINKLMIEKNTKTLNIVSDMKLKYSHISSKTEFVSGDMLRLIGELDNAFFEKSTLEDETKGTTIIINEKEKEIQELEEKINSISTELSDIDTKIAAKNEEKENLLSNRSEFYRRRDEIQNELTSLDREIFTTKTNLEKSTEKLGELTNYMYTEYNLTYNEAKEQCNIGDQSEQDLKKLIKEKKKEIANLGPINLGALEQYKEVSGRYELLTGQYNDLKASEDEIAKIVDELDKAMREQFEESFKNIKVEFDRVFKELFGGGKATLELIETKEGDVLDAGVNIVVQPPGKKLGNMMQLSGGEKALTAISLLFAIQNLKPSPFCLLDEIEAALDESNVDRFADYLHNLTKDTQFILITHRRGTMEKADRLYGITMQEKGVTALVSVDLVQDEIKA